MLSKVVKFVRNPTTNWADLDQQETDRESTYSKQMLKEMIERKRRNDFVRKREFDMLRKMRRSEVMAGQDTGARPSFFQSSLPSKPDDRASTLKKIDEIEAQMSMQWWKTKHGDSSTARQQHQLSDVLAHAARFDRQRAGLGASGPRPTTRPSRCAADGHSAADRANEPSEPAMLQSMPDSFPPSSRAGPVAAPAPDVAPAARRGRSGLGSVRPRRRSSRRHASRP